MSRIRDIVMFCALLAMVSPAADAAPKVVKKSSVKRASESANAKPIIAKPGSITVKAPGAGTSPKLILGGTAGAPKVVFKKPIPTSKKSNDQSAPVTHSAMRNTLTVKTTQGSGSLKASKKEIEKSSQPLSIVYSSPRDTGRLAKGVAQPNPTISTAKSPIKQQSAAVKAKESKIQIAHKDLKSDIKKLISDKSKRIKEKDLSHLDKDPRYPRAHGWRKMERTYQGGKGANQRTVTTHSQYNVHTKAEVDIKVVNGTTGMLKPGS